MHSPCAAPPGVCTEYLTIPPRRPPDARPPTLSLFRVYQVLILILYVVLGHSLELWKDAHKADPGQRGGFVCTFHESGPAILLGERRIPYKVTQDNTPPWTGFPVTPQQV